MLVEKGALPTLSTTNTDGGNELLQKRSRHSCRNLLPHDGYAIGMIESGVEAFTYRGANHQAPAGSIVVIHPGEVHTGHAGIPDGWTYRMLYPQVSLMQKAAAELMGRSLGVPYFPQSVIDDPQLAIQLRYLHIALETSISLLERESRFLSLFTQLLVRHADAQLRIPTVNSDYSQLIHTDI